MAKRARVRQEVDQLAKRVAVGGEVKVRRFGRGGRRKFGSTKLRSQREGKEKDLLEMGEIIADLAQLYADQAPVLPGRFGGGLLWHGKGGVPRSAYPFRRSDRRKGERPYRSSFYVQIDKSRGSPAVAVGNRAESAAFVEFGTLGGASNPTGTRARLQALTDAEAGSRPQISVRAGSRKLKARFYAIPLKAQRARGALNRKNITYAERKNRAYASVDPEYRQWYRAKRRRELGERESFVDSLGRRRKRRVKVPPKPSIVDRALEEKRESFSFVGEDKMGRPTLFVRRFEFYPGYGILRRATVDGTQLYLRR